jgi:hypothetical protein
LDAAGHGPVRRLTPYSFLLIRDFGAEKADRIFFEANKKAGEEYYKNILTRQIQSTSSLPAEIFKELRSQSVFIGLVVIINFPTPKNIST